MRLFFAFFHPTKLTVNKLIVHGVLGLRWGPKSGKLDPILTVYGNEQKLRTKIWEIWPNFDHLYKAISKKLRTKIWEIWPNFDHLCKAISKKLRTKIWEIWPRFDHFVSVISKNWGPKSGKFDPILTILFR